MRAIIILVIFLTCTNLFQDSIQIWKQSSLIDFRKNYLKNLEVRDNNGVEVCFSNPMIKTGSDYIDDGSMRYLAYDSSGNYIHAWPQNGNIYVQKYDSCKISISPKLQVNDIEGISVAYTKLRVALLDNGYFCVVWVDQGGRDHNMYGQIFSNLNTKIDSNFVINEITNFSNYIPVVWSNNLENNFWIFYSLRHNHSYKIFIQKRDLDGLRIGQTFLLNPDNPTVYEDYPTVIYDKKGSLVVAWVGSNSNISTDCDIYVRRYNLSAEPLSNALKINDESKKTWNGQPDICLDNKGNYFLAWSDFRDNQSEYYPYTYAIYGQIINSSLKKLDRNFRINIPSALYNIEPDVDFIKDEFQVTWIAGELDTYVNRWQFRPIESGEIISIIYDTENDRTRYVWIDWEESVSPETSINLKIRTGKTKDDLLNSQWFGPSQSQEFYNLSSGMEINSRHNGHRFIQYSATFNSYIPSYSPILKSVSIHYRINSVPESYTLYQNYPNPFNSETIVSYQLPERDYVELKVFNLEGQIIRTLISEVQSADLYKILWDGRSDDGTFVASGLYFYQNKTSKFMATKKMILIR